MTDLFSEGLISLHDAAKLDEMPARRGGAKPSYGTLIRWATKGYAGTRLETLRVGGTLCTSRPAIGRFFTRLSEPAPATHSTTAKAKKSAARAGDFLDALGIK